MEVTSKMIKKQIPISLEKIVLFLVIFIASVFSFHSFQFDSDGARYIYAIQNFDFAGLAGHIIYFYINWALFFILKIFSLSVNFSVALFSFLCALSVIFFTDKITGISSPYSNKNIYIVAILFFSAPLFVYFLQETDVTMLAGIFLITSYYFFEKAEIENKPLFKYLSVIFYIFAFFTHTNTIFWGAYYLIKLINNKLSIKEALISSCIAVITILLICLYPFFYLGNIKLLYQWIFVSPSYTYKCIFKNLFLILILFGLINWGLLIYGLYQSKRLIYEQLDILVPFSLAILVYVMTSADEGYYIASTLSWLPIFVLLIIRNIRIPFPLWLKILVIVFIIINFCFFKVLFTLKNDMLKNAFYIIDNNVPSSSYIYSEFLTPYLLAYYKDREVIEDIDWEEEKIIKYSNFAIRSKNLNQKISFNKIKQNSIYILSFQPLACNKNLTLKMKKNFSYDFFLWKYIKRPCSWYKNLYLYQLS